MVAIKKTVYIRKCKLLKKLQTLIFDSSSVFIAFTRRSGNKYFKHKMEAIVAKIKNMLLINNRGKTCFGSKSAIKPRRTENIAHETAPSFIKNDFK